jgi:Peptidase A4 family
MMKKVYTLDHTASLFSSALTRQALEVGRKAYLSSYLFLAFFLCLSAVGAQAFLPEMHYGPYSKAQNGTSQNWSGYLVATDLQALQKKVVTDVQAKWAVPTVTCGSTNTYSAAWVGIDGYLDNTVEQTGTSHNCISGQQIYYAWYELYPRGSRTVIRLVIHPGDTMFAEVSYTNGSFVLTLKNLTTQNSFSVTQNMSANRQSAEWIVEAPSSKGTILPLANFGTIQFTNAQTTVNGITGTITNSNWQNDGITMASNGTIKAQTSSLSEDGKSCSVTWEHS